jgi:hypothetical protein
MGYPGNCCFAAASFLCIYRCKIAPKSSSAAGFKLLASLNTAPHLITATQAFLLKLTSAWYNIPSSRSNLLVTAVSTSLVAISNSDASMADFQSISAAGIAVACATGAISFFGTHCYLRAMEAPGAQASVITSLCGLYPYVLCILGVL